MENPQTVFCRYSENIEKHFFDGVLFSWLLTKSESSFPQFFFSIDMLLGLAGDGGKWENFQTSRKEMNLFN